jgi:hypothetical protein
VLSDSIVEQLVETAAIEVGVLDVPVDASVTTHVAKSEIRGDLVETVASDLAQAYRVTRCDCSA